MELRRADTSRFRGQLLHLCPEDGKSFCQATLSLFPNGLRIQAHAARGEPAPEPISLAWSPFSLVQACRLHSMQADAAQPMMRLFKAGGGVARQSARGPLCARAHRRSQLLGGGRFRGSEPWASTGGRLGGSRRVREGRPDLGSEALRAIEGKKRRMVPQTRRHPHRQIGGRMGRRRRPQRNSSKHWSPATPRQKSRPSNRSPAPPCAGTH